MKKEFEPVIGYDDIKKELERLCDTLLNSEKYEKLGVRIPSGLLLQGKPGTGKTTMAKCFIEASGRKAYTCRKTKTSDEFISEIVKIFEEAEKNVPSIVFLDDIDKFSSCKGYGIDADEFVTIQSCMDNVRDKGVFVIATANDPDKLPSSLKRAGRFGKVINVECPEGKDAESIMRYYLRNKKLDEDVDICELAAIMRDSSCATLEDVINEAGINAGYNNKETIDMHDIVEAVLDTIFEAPKPSCLTSFQLKKRIAYHEAGHIVTAEMITPGSVSIASIRNSNVNGGSGGFTMLYPEYDEDSAECYMRILKLALGGKAATEIVFGSMDSGAYSDLRKAFDIAERTVETYCAYGFDKWQICLDSPTKATERKEYAVSSELDKAYAETKKIIIDNRAFLDAVAQMLIEKDTILSSDIAAIRNEISITV